VSEALKEASKATVSAQRLREVKIYLAVLPVYPRLYAGDELVRPTSLAGVVQAASQAGTRYSVGTQAVRRDCT